MNNGKNNLALAVSGVIVVALTIAAFFLLEIERTSVFIWAICALILSEIVFFAGIIMIRNIGSNHNAVFAKSGATVSLSIYFISTLVLTLLSGLFRNNVNIFILLNLALVAACAIAVIGIMAVSKATQRRNEADVSKVGEQEGKRGGF